MSLTVVSYGGGVQSNAMLTLAARGWLDVQERPIQGDLFAEGPDTCDSGACWT